jgi:hypothetical protein
VAPPEQPLVVPPLSGQARATVPHDGGVVVGALVRGVHEPESAGGATLTRAARRVTTVEHDEDGVTVMVGVPEQEALCS